MPVVYMDCDLVVMNAPVHLQHALQQGADVAIVNFYAAPVVCHYVPAEDKVNIQIFMWYGCADIHVV